MTWIPATSAYPMMTWYQVWYQTSIQISTSPNQNPTGIGSRLRPTGSKSDGKISSEVNLVTKLDHNYTHNYAIVPKLQPGNFYHMYVKACNNAGCSQSINRMFDFPTTSPQSRKLFSLLCSLKEMMISVKYTGSKNPQIIMIQKRLRERITGRAPLTLDISEFYLLQLNFNGMQYLWVPFLPFKHT